MSKKIIVVGDSGKEDKMNEIFKKINKQSIHLSEWFKRNPTYSSEDFDFQLECLFGIIFDKIIELSKSKSEYSDLGKMIYNNFGEILNSNEFKIDIPQANKGIIAVFFKKHTSKKNGVNDLFRVSN